MNEMKKAGTAMARAAKRNLRGADLEAWAQEQEARAAEAMRRGCEGDAVKFSAAAAMARR